MRSIYDRLPNAVLSSLNGLIGMQQEDSELNTI